MSPGSFVCHCCSARLEGRVLLLMLASCRVECGDYHFGALSSSGRLYTFGEYSNGALGHGRDNIRLPEDLRSPRRSLAQPYKVEFFDPLRSRAATSEEYCFNVAMAGWASSALTVDLTEGDHLEKERVGNEASEED